MAQANLQEGREASQPNSSKYIQSLRAKHKSLCRKLANMNTEQKDESISQVQRGMLEELKAVQSHVMDLILEELPDDVDEDLAKDKAFHSLYASKAAKLIVIDKKPSSTTTPPEVASSSVSIQHHLNIPMPTFDGLYEHWSTFKAMFLDIMKRTNDSDAVKLHHLNKALQGKAAGILNTSILNGNNFQAAWDVLERRFENPRLIVDKHIAGLLQLKHAPQESAKDLRKLAETCKSHVDGLVFMKQTIDSTSNLIITHLLSSCMDADTRKAWESSLEHGEFPDLFKTLDFINRQCEVLESCTPETSRKSTSTKAFTSTTAANPSCVLCQQHHTLQNCPTFIAMSVVQRKSKVQSLKRCFNCLSAGHPVSQCQSKWTCRICRKRHHHLLHGDQLPAAPSLQPPDAATTSHQLPVDAAQPTFIGASMTSLTTAVPSTVLLSTVVLNITDHAGVSHPARAVLDSGAQSNFITGRMAQFLELPRKLINLPLSGIGGSTRSNVRHSIETTIHSRCSSYAASLELLVLPKLSADLPTQQIDISHWKIPETCILADPSFNRPGTIDIILGATHFYEILRIGRLSLGDSMPTLQETEFSWVVSGTITEPMSPVMCAVATHTNELGNLMEQCFTTEGLSNTPSWSSEERACEDHDTATTTREEDGRYMVQLPRKPEMIGKPGNSTTIALRRFLALERRLQREPETQRAYVDFMDEYLRFSHTSKVAASSKNDESFYLPHHPAFKTDSTTTKCRVVFDASSKSSTGVSLNDTLMVGPTIQQDATSILLWFWTQPIALTADVTKMYRQVWIHPKDRSLQRIIWRSSPNDPIQEYELNTVTYGTASAPFLAVRSLQQIVADHGGEFPAAAERSCDFYVDDFVSGGQSSKAAQLLQLQTEQLYASAGFELRKWASSDPSVLQNVNQEKLASSPYATSGSKGLLATLGLIWDPASDTLQFKINTPYVIGAITKRKVLSCIARIYDPLGIVDPVKAMAKQFLQRIWTLQTEQQQPWGWDDELPHHLQGEWINFHNQLIHLQNLHIPRVAIRPDSTSSQFHFFCNASEKGYGACCYIRSRDDNGNIMMQLYASKTKVPPINSKHSIARLELCAAQLSSLLYDRVRLAVKLSSPATFWTDSMTIVHWLRASPNCWKPFVANRVSQVQHLTQGNVWRHIPGVDNPADLASRGCLSKDLLDNPLWWQGPSWIHLPEDQWPESPVPSSCEAAVAEQRVTTVACPATEKPPHRIFTLYSSFSKLRTTVAYWVQYFNKRFKRRQYVGIGLTTQDLREAEEVLRRLAQQDLLEQEIKALQHNKPIPSSSKLKWLHPQLGANGIIRVGGRLSNAPLLEDIKHPILVPNNHPLAELLMDHFHKTRLHAGPQLMLSSSRQRYWINSIYGTVCWEKGKAAVNLNRSNEGGGGGGGGIDTVRDNE
uniref:uncharacterized protein LOC125907331 n=1 Tax=Anopheles coluzzii TaxID=1518534 RepID=UPI0020FFA7D7|nr:uncharacterized protein LOC125907331 [Anopheles coluzzii]